MVRAIPAMHPASHAKYRERSYPRVRHIKNIFINTLLYKAAKQVIKTALHPTNLISFFFRKIFFFLHINGTNRLIIDIELRNIPDNFPNLVFWQISLSQYGADSFRRDAYHPVINFDQKSVLVIKI